MGSFAISGLGNRLEGTRPESVEDSLRLGVLEAADHIHIVYRYAEWLNLNR